MSTITTRPCWQPADVSYAVPIDAGAMSDELFRFAHVPGVITRRRFRGYGSAAEEGTRCTEEEVLDDILAGEAAMRVAAVVGEVGTGKSHLVRWLYVELKRRQRFDPALAGRLHVVYVPKTRSTLKRVVDLILAGQTGEQFDEFRQRLQRAQDHFNPGTAKQRLVDELANSIRDRASVDATIAIGVDGQTARPDAYRQALIEKLPALLQDDIYREALIREGGVIDQTIAIALERRGSEHGVPRFTEDDLQLDLTEVTAMSKAAKQLFAKIGTEKYMDRAIALLNEVLDSAVGALFDVKRGEVGELLVDVRAALEQQGRELVLLVEDLALLQGVEQELLEAIIAPKHEVDGRQLCAVRAAFAATPGHFERMPTVRSRLDADNGFLYSLDASLTDDDHGPSASLSDALKLVGSYLNAARWGKDEIEAWANDNPDVTGDPPNRCHDCELATSCLKGFGASPDLGHGLYPFNATAIYRMLLGESIRHFEPRLVLKHVRDTLRDEREALIKGQFPTDRWANQYNPALTPIADKVITALQNAHRSADAARRAEHLLMFWAGETERVVNLPEDIHEAFAILEVSGAPTIGPEPAITKGLPTSPPAPGRRPRTRPRSETPSSTPYEDDQRTIAAWRTALLSSTPQQSELPGALARDLRYAFAEFLLDRLPASLEFLSYERQPTIANLANGIYIEGAAGGNPRSDAATVLRLGAESEQLFNALRARARKHELESTHLDALLDAGDKHTDEAMLWLFDAVGNRADQSASADLAYIGALLSGTFPDADQTIENDGETITAMLAGRVSAEPPEELPKRRELADLITQDWKPALDVLFRSTAIRQNPSRGEPLAIDAAAWLTHVDEFRAKNLSATATRARTGIPATLATATEALSDVILEGRAVLDLITQSLNELEEDADASSVSKAFGLMLDAVAYANIEVGDLTARRNHAETLQSIDIPALRGQLGELAVSRNRDQALRYQSRVAWRDAITLKAGVEAASEVIVEAKRSLSPQPSKPASGYSGPSLVDSADECRTALRELADAIAVVAH